MGGGWNYMTTAPSAKGLLNLPASVVIVLSCHLRCN
jgi:hypothetical protein